MTGYKSENFLQIVLELSKVKITIAVAFTTITGYILALNSYDFGFILPTLGIFFLACGSSVINHLQEKRTDAIMLRTRTRPLPSGKISSVAAMGVAAIEVLAGSALLLFSAGILALGLGLMAMVWYNLIYTNLKKKTPNAVIPGSVIGSIPPLVGWVAAGGEIVNLEALMMAIFFFLWQVPHFYLLAIKYGHEYEEAGLPSLTSFYSLKTIKNNIFIWVIFTALSATAFSLSRPSGTWLSTLFIFLFSIWLVFTFSSLLKGSKEPFRAGKYFMKINYFVLAVVVMLVADPLLQRVLFHLS